jgi:hypothetical protein
LREHEANNGQDGIPGRKDMGRNGKKIQARTKARQEEMLARMQENTQAMREEIWPSRNETHNFCIPV